ncbi:PTS system N-acetylglucosamine-specific transporter subunit IIBC [Arthrobacter crystallopoietes BAB-32]|uniref:PTS system N-acetylglucosamine-specific transporter subunit IIBC n=1 Tax=Arthrobacter crystallopoietes BAB-32 TaxID=1246476 RepID=N1V3K0_9MICC|nr:DUF6010 family protein [Arthrobacter crystallopoietes]EMY32788.1 PTS system N-acetylglucosamine-specific transporter subunit IIBC [Arthrobacter crystallopoietes BAB-32]
METSTLIGNYLLGGAINAAVLVAIAFALSRFAKDSYGRSLLAIFLVIAGGAYVGFAIVAEASGLWALAELLHAIALGALGLLGLRRSPYWLALGWALHPLWDVPLHFFGGGHEFAPESWAIACVTFDWVVALYIVLAYRRSGGSRFRFRTGLPAAKMHRQTVPANPGAVR